jgi:hypothetical protein
MWRRRFAACSMPKVAAAPVTQGIGGSRRQPLLQRAACHMTSVNHGRRVLLVLLIARVVINATFAAVLVLDPPATYAALLPLLRAFGLVDGAAALLITPVVRRTWSDGPYWMASLATGLSRLAMAALLIALPDLAKRPLILLTFIAVGSIVAVINGIMKFVLAAHLRRGSRPGLAALAAVFGLLLVAVALILGLRLDPTVGSARALLPVISAFEAFALGVLAVVAARTRGTLTKHRPG